MVYLVYLVLFVMFTVTGGTYAFLAFTASNNTIVGTTASASLNLTVERKLPSSVGVMVPQLEDYLDSAISTEYNCIDGNGNTVCQVYKAVVTNTSTATVKVNGTISFTGIDNMPNLKWKQIKNETTVGSYASYNATTNNAYFERNQSLQPGDSKTYHFVIWIDETGEVQTDKGTFRTTINFEPATDGGLTSTIVPISYMTGFTSSTDYSYYRSDAYREKIKNVYFVDYINTTGSVESWDMSDLNMNEAGSVIAWINTNTTDSNYYDLYIGSNQLIGGLDFSHLFRGLKNAENISFDNFDTRMTNNMRTMFSDCISLINLDIEKFDTSNVTDMAGMFQNCSSLTDLEVSGFDTSKVTNMHNMFKGCESLINIDVSGFDTRNVTTMEQMFYNCVELTSLDVSGFDTSSVTSMRAMFGGNSSKKMNLTSVDVSRFDTSNVTDVAGMFLNCVELTILDVSGFDTNKVTNMKQMFYNCVKLTSLDVSKWDTSNVVDMSYVFYNCISLTNMDVSKFDTNKVTTMYAMFGNCKRIMSLDVGNWDTSEVMDMAYMFQNCTKLTTLNVSKWDTSSVTDMKGMFGGTYNTSDGSSSEMNLINLNVSEWNTSKVTDMAGMFQNCTKLTTLNVSKWDTSSVTDMNSMFGASIGRTMNLTNIDVSGFDTSKVTDMGYMFHNCSKLSTTIKIKNAGTTTYEYMFNGAATETGASITVNYTSATSSLVDSMITTKSEGSNVVKGSLVS